MIRKFIDKLLGKPADTQAASGIPQGKRLEIPAAEHGIDPTLLDERAVRVVTTLQDAGFEAYIVGGAVRDLLVGRRPRTSTSPPMPHRSRSRACSAAPSSSAGAFASST